MSVPSREECLATAARVLQEAEGVLERGEPPALAAAAASIAQGWARLAMALGVPASSPGAAPAAQEEQHTRAWLVGEQWMVHCPAHGDHKAFEMAAKGKTPAAVKCTGKTRGEWCQTGVPVDLAYAQAGRG